MTLYATYVGTLNWKRPDRMPGRFTMLENVFKDRAGYKSRLRNFRHVGKVARKRGWAIAICHSYRDTVQALEDGIPMLEKTGVRFVPASHLIHLLGSGVEFKPLAVPNPAL